MKDNMTLLVTEAKKGSQAAYEALYQNGSLTLKYQKKYCKP